MILVITSYFLIPTLSKEKNNSPGGNRQQGPILADAFIITTRSLDNVIRTSGTVIPNEEVEVRSEVSRRLTGIHFTEGSYVPRGKVLFSLDNSELNAQLRKFEIQEELAIKKLDRDELLRERGLLPEQDYEISVNELERIRADIDLVRVQISKTYIRAPFPGIAGLRNVSRGSYVTPSDVLTTIQDISKVKIDFSIPERYVLNFRKGQKVTFTTDAADGEFTAEIYASETSLDVNTRTVMIRAISNNPGGILKPGVFANVTFTLDDIKDAIMIPAQALIPKLKGHEVYIVKDGKARSIDVEMGLRTENEVQIFSPEINVGDTLVITNILRLRQNAEIKIENIKQ